MKRAGYDMDAGAKRLQDLLDKQKKEREEREMNSTKSEEASPMIKPPKNEFGKKEDAFTHAKQHGGKVMKKTFTHPTSGMKTVSYVVREDAEQIDELKRTTLANYVSKAAGSYGRDKQNIGRESPDGTVAKARPELKRAVKNRLTGINRAAERLAKEETEIDEASKKPNATTRHLRDYPVSDKDVAKPITYYSLVHKATNKVLSTHKDLESAKDEHRGMDQGERAHYRIATSTKAPKSFSMKEDAEIYEAIKKPNATTRFLRQYPVSDKEMAKPVKKPKNKKPEQGVAEATVDIADIEKKKYITPSDKRTLGKIHDLMAREKALQQAKLAKTTKAVKEESVFKSEIDEAAPFSYGFVKPPRKGTVAYNALMKRKEQDKNRVKEIEAIGTKNHHVGVAKVTREDIEDVTEANDDMYKYIDQSGGQVIKGKSGTYVGYTHSATKGKGANILKHHNTKKYYAAGGSSTAFTQKTTLHDTPQAAAKAYHKGNLAEEINYGKSFRELREAAFNYNCCPDEDYGFTEEEFTVTGNEQYEDWGDDIVEGKLSFSKLSQRLQEEDGKNVKLNKPFLTPGGPKKRAVYVKNDKGNTVKVNFGDPNLEIKRDDPERRSSFRARHNCDNPGPKWKARYWSCKFWSSTPVSKL